MKKIRSDYDVIEITRLLALTSVLNEYDFDSDYIMRKVCRWYSKTFSTPLHTVEEDIPLFKIFQHYWEDRFENLKEDSEESGNAEFIPIIEDALLTPEQRIELKRKKSADTEEVNALAREIEERESKEHQIRSISNTFKKEQANLPEGESNRFDVINKLTESIERVEKVFLSNDELSKLGLDLFKDVEIKKK